MKRYPEHEVQIYKTKAWSYLLDPEDIYIFTLRRELASSNYTGEFYRVITVVVTWVEES